MNFHSKARAVLTFGKAIQPFIDAGMKPEALIPVAPRNAKVYVRKDGKDAISSTTLGKVPGRYLQSGEWSGFSRGKGEPSLLDTGATPDEQRQFMTWPTPNVGVLGRFYPGVDADTNTPAAARLVAKAIAEKFGADRFIPRRTRGDSTRALYVFEADKPGTVTSRSIEFELPGEAKGITHKLEVSGQGRQWVGSGIHPSGQSYGWDFSNHIEDTRDADLIVITDADVADLFDIFTRELTGAGGTVLSVGAGKAAGGNGGELRDFAHADPAMPPEAVFRGLDRLPNTRAHFPTHDDLVAMLGAVRAALGSEADDCEDDVRRWATAHEDDTGADDAYFERVWRSLDAGVRVDRDSLDRRFRREGIRVSAPHDFPDDDVAANAVAENVKWEASTAAKKVRLLREVADNFIFSTVNTAEGEAFLQIRPRGEIGAQKKALDWWLLKSDLSDEIMLADLHELFGKGDHGLWVFFRALKHGRPDCVFKATTKNPLRDIGEMVESIDKQGNVFYELNTLALPPAQKMGARLPKGSGSPDGNADVALVLEFMGMTFGEHVGFELDVISFMAQKKKRVGNGLVLHGDQGTGKSTYTKILSKLFNGVGEANYIPGNKLKGDERAFYLTALEGARILDVQELPSDMKVEAKANFESLVKQIIDSSESGDTVKVENKGKDLRPVPNYARFVMTTNHLDAIKVSVDDRRLFYVSSGITRENKPGDPWWVGLNAVLNDPRRMAHFWRYLLDRNVEGFNHHQAPPVTRAKLAQQIVAIDSPVSRHMRVVVMALSSAGRKLVDSAEIKALMRAAACNEAKNTKHRVDDQDAYEDANWKKPGTIKEAFLFLQHRYPVLREMRTKKARIGTMYVVSGDILAKILETANNQEILDALDDDRERHRLTEDHWPAGYEGPLHADAKGAGDFD